MSFDSKFYFLYCVWENEGEEDKSILSRSFQSNESSKPSRQLKQSSTWCLQGQRCAWARRAEYEEDHWSGVGIGDGFLKTLTSQWRAEGQEGAGQAQKEKCQCGHRGSPEQRPGGRDLVWVGMELWCSGWRGRKGPCAMLKCWDLPPLYKKEPLQSLIWPVFWFRNHQL